MIALAGPRTATSPFACSGRITTPSGVSSPATPPRGRCSGSARVSPLPLIADAAGTILKRSKYSLTPSAARSVSIGAELTVRQLRVAPVDDAPRAPDAVPRSEPSRDPAKVQIGVSSGRAASASARSWPPERTHSKRSSPSGAEPAPNRREVGRVGRPIRDVLGPEPIDVADVAGQVVDGPVGTRRHGGVETCFLRGVPEAVDVRSDRCDVSVVLHRRDATCAFCVAPPPRNAMGCGGERQPPRPQRDRTRVRRRHAGRVALGCRPPVRAGRRHGGADDRHRPELDRGAGRAAHRVADEGAAHLALVAIGGPRRRGVRGSRRPSDSLPFRRRRWPSPRSSARSHHSSS